MRIDKTDIVYFGLRISLGVIFVVHGLEKFAPAIAVFYPQMGLPSEMRIPTAFAEFVPAVLLLVGIMTRISSVMLSIVMLGAIFYVLKASSLTGPMGYEFPLILLASALVLITTGPGRISISHLIKKMPRFLH